MVVVLTRRRTILLATALFCIGLLPLAALGRGEGAQEPVADESLAADRIRMTVAIQFQNAVTTGISPVLLHPALMSSVADLAAAAPDLSISPVVSPEASTPAEVRERAASSDSLLWMRIVLIEGERTVSVEAQAGAVPDGNVLLELSYEVPVGPAGVSYRRLWQPLQRELAESVDRMTRIALGAVGTGRFELRTLPHAQLTVLETDQTALADDTGFLSLELPAPATYTLTLRAREHYPVTGQFLLTSAGTRRSIAPDVRSHWLYDFSMQNMSFPAFDARRRFFGDMLFAHAGFTTYVLGLAPVDRDWDDLNETDGIFSSTPATDLRLGLGSYLSGTHGERRFYASLGATGRLIHGAGMFAFDPVAPATAHLSLGVEGNPDRRSRLFFEWAPALVFTEFPGIVELRFPGVVFLPDDWAAAVPVARHPIALGFVRLGLRWQP